VNVRDALPEIELVDGVAFVKTPDVVNASEDEPESWPLPVNVPAVVNVRDAAPVIGETLPPASVKLPEVVKEREAPPERAPLPVKAPDVENVSDEPPEIGSVLLDTSRIRKRAAPPADPSVFDIVAVATGAALDVPAVASQYRTIIELSLPTEDPVRSASVTVLKVTPVQVRA
jgi:hypothetical protein